jgi:hypothetical protein
MGAARGKRQAGPFPASISTTGNGEITAKLATGAGQGPEM